MLGHFLASIYRTPRVDCHPSEDARCCSAPSLCWGYKLGSTKAGNFQGERKDIHMFSINADKWFSLGQISDSALSPLHFKPPSLGTMRSGKLCSLLQMKSHTREGQGSKVLPAGRPTSPRGERKEGENKWSWSFVCPRHFMYMLIFKPTHDPVWWELPSLYIKRKLRGRRLHNFPKQCVMI